MPVSSTKHKMVYGTVFKCVDVKGFFGFVCLFLTIVGFFLKFVLLYQRMRSPPGLFFGILWKGAVGFPLQVADTTNSIQTGNSYHRKCYLGFFLNYYYLKKETKNCHAASLVSLESNLCSSASLTTTRVLTTHPQMNQAVV